MPLISPLIPVPLMTSLCWEKIKVLRPFSFNNHTHWLEHLSFPKWHSRNRFGKWNDSYCRSNGQRYSF